MNNMEKFKYFDWAEFNCKCGCGFNNISLSLLCKLETAREHAKVPFYINSGCRCKTHNKAVKGSKTSFHMKGLAVDIKASNNHTRMKIIRGLIKADFKNIIIYETFIHVDIRKDEIGVMLK